MELSSSIRIAKFGLKLNIECTWGIIGVSSEYRIVASKSHASFIKMAHVEWNKWLVICRIAYLPIYYFYNLKKLFFTFNTFDFFKTNRSGSLIGSTLCFMKCTIKCHNKTWRRAFRVISEKKFKDCLWKTAVFNSKKSKHDHEIWTKNLVWLWVHITFTYICL